MAHMHITYFPPSSRTVNAGIYAPTLQLTAGWTSDYGAGNWYYTTVTTGGDTYVTVTGVVAITSDAAESSSLTISLPAGLLPTANWSAKWQVSGLGVPESADNTTVVGAVVGAKTAFAVLTALAADTIDYCFTFTYRIP